jgi:acyl-CoA synthetase (AMP-forming)/AMP-acid ligase II
LTPLAPRWKTIGEVLLALEGCSRFGARFVPRSGDPAFYTYDEVLRRAKQAAGTLQAAGLQPGDRVALILATSIHFLDSFLGIQLAGGIPAPLYPPLQLGKLPEYFDRTRRMMSQIGTRFLITESRIKKILGLAVQEVKSLERVFDAPDLLTSAPWTPVPLDPEAPAFLQFSSGTTSQPKAVVISHTNLLHSLEMMDGIFQRYDEQKAEEGAVCWLPLYHDMGLVGFLLMGLYHPGTITYIGPEVFIANPAIWLQTISKFRGALSAAPSFAYGYCLERIKDEELAGVDLSSWIIALNGAEPIDVEIMERFTRRFSQYGLPAGSLTPAYGLAEAGLAVTFSELEVPPVITEFDRDELSEQGIAVPGKGRRLPSVGKPVAGLEVEVWDQDDRPLEEGHVGRIVIRGPSVTKGYWEAPEATAGVIRSGWLDTGDLGFFHQGELYISGRLKDLIIIRGRNYAPQEIEELLSGIEGLRPASAAAVSHGIENQGEQLIILAERDARFKRSDDELSAEIRQCIISGISLTPFHVQILDPGTLPRTPTAKIRRSEALRQFLAGELVPPEEVGALRLLQELGKSTIAWGRFRLRHR